MQPVTNNLILHDSTGNFLSGSKIFPEGEQTVKKWAPDIDIASKTLASIIAKKSVVLISGVRHVKQMMNKEITTDELKIKMDTFISTVKDKSPQDKLMICSIIPYSDRDIVSCAEQVNKILKSFCHIENITFIDTASRFKNTSATMNGLHTKRNRIGLLASPIKAAVSKALNLGNHNDRRHDNLKNREYDRINHPKQNSRFHIKTDKYV
jgi:hypothetical protein